MRRRIVLGLAAGLVLALGIDGSATSDGPIKSRDAALIGAVRVESVDPLFGGFSALSVGPNGADIIVLSDRGAYAQGQILRDPGGAVAALRLAPVTLLRPTKGADSGGRNSDSEGLAIASDGQIYVSFESLTRVSRFARLDAVPVDLPDNAAFEQLPVNKGLEALAIDAMGTLYAVPEAKIGETIPVHVFREGKWRDPLTLPRIGSFLPVAADFGPDGQFYLLERRFDGLSGFATRLRRFGLGANGFSEGEILLQTAAGRHDNLEGLSIWRAPDGLRATMISDDNFFALQVTEIVEYRLPD